MIIRPSRRGFLTSMAAAFAAPAIIPYANLMPVRPIFIFQDWLPCNGRILRRKDHPELFKILGTVYGGDDKSFNLPYGGVTPGPPSNIPGVQYIVSHIRATPSELHPIGGIVFKVTGPPANDR